MHFKLQTRKLTKDWPGEYYRLLLSRISYTVYVIPKKSWKELIQKELPGSRKNMKICMDTSVR
jgi:hypothetical protein